jgi:hypothetical protein
VVAVSNHLTQATIGKLRWSAPTLTLTGETKGVPADSYHVVMYCPPEFEPDVATVDKKPVFLVKHEGGIWWVPVRGNGIWQEWSVHFQIRPESKIKVAAAPDAAGGPVT